MATRPIADLISAPLEELIAALGSGIGRSQAALDRHSIEIQRIVDEDPELAAHGVTATWYAIPTTDLELKISLAMQGRLNDPIERPQLWAQPVSATFRNQFDYDVQAASTVTLRVAAVPPPGPATATAAVHTGEEALAAARPFLHPTDAPEKPPEDRVTVNFNPGTRAWYVVQSRETAAGVVERRALVKVDDETLTVVRHEP